MIKNIIIQNSMKFVNYSVIDLELLNKIYDDGNSYKEPITPSVVILLPPIQVEVLSLGHIYSLSMVNSPCFQQNLDARRDVPVLKRLASRQDIQTHAQDQNKFPKEFSHISSTMIRFAKFHVIISLCRIPNQCNAPKE